MVKASTMKDGSSYNVSKGTINVSNGYTEKAEERLHCFVKTRRLNDKEELRGLYKKLREVVPSCKAKSVSSLEIVLRAVDYINELHQILEDEFPGVPKPFPELSSRQPNHPVFVDPVMAVSSDAKKLSFRDVTNATMATATQTTPKLRD